MELPHVTARSGDPTSAHPIGLGRTEREPSKVPASAGARAMVGERVAQAGEGSGAPSAHLCRLRHWNLYLGRPTQGSRLLVSVTCSVKGADAQGVASGVGPETEEHVAPGAARRLHEAAHTIPGETEAGVGGASARSHGVRKADPEPAPSSGPRLGSPEPPGEPAGPAAFQRPTPVWYDARQQSDSLGRRKAGPCRLSLVQCALSTHAQSLLGNVVPAAFRRWQACLPRSPGQQPSITTRGAGKWSPSLAPASASSRSWMGCTVKRPVGFLGSPRPSKSHPNAKHWKLLRFLEATRAQSPKGKA